MNRTLIRNIHESFPLASGKVSKERELHFNFVGEFEPVLAVSTIRHVDSCPIEFNAHSFERPLLTIGVHSQSNANARSQRYQQQLIWVWSGIVSAGIKRFVCLVTMRADRNLLAESRPPTIDNHSSTHDPPLN